MTTGTKTIILGAASLAAMALAGCAGGASAGSGSGVKPTGAGAAPRVAGAQPGEFDPYALGVTGDSGTAFPKIVRERMTLGQTQPPFQPSDAPHQFYGEVLAERGHGFDGIDPTRASGGNLAQVSFSVEGADFDPCVSRDGRFIIFASTQHSPTADLYIKPVDSRTVSQLTNDPAHDVMPQISPDGQRVAFASNRAGNWDIFVMPITGGSALQVTSESSHELHPSWSPDGKRLAFCRLGEVSGRWEIWVTDVHNTGVAQFLTYGLFPEWCPVAGTGESGGDQILFQRSRGRGDRAFSVWTIDYKSGMATNPTEIAASPVAACINPSWSPDAQWITFATVPNPVQWAAMTESRPAAANLWMVRAKGGGLVSLTSGSSVNLMPVWGPGNQLYFISDRGGVDNIWTMSTADAILAATGRPAENGTTARTPLAPVKETTGVASVPN